MKGLRFSGSLEAEARRRDGQYALAAIIWIAWCVLVYAAVPVAIVVWCIRHHLFP